MSDGSTRSFPDNARVILIDGRYKGYQACISMLWGNEEYLVTVQTETTPLIFAQANEMILWRDTNQVYEHVLKDLDELA